MKDLVRRASAFLTFDLPLQPVYIGKQFTSTHSQYRQLYPDWGLEATRKKVISYFWFRQVLFHFGAVFSLAIILVVPLISSGKYLLVSGFLAGFTSFITLVIFYYWPTYYSSFLPILDNIEVENQRQIASNEEVKKCKRTQFSIPALTIIFYTFSKISNIPLPPCNDQSAALLNNLYGADRDKLKQNLSRLYKFSCLSARERAEIQKGISTARTFFDMLGSSHAQTILNQLEIKTNLT